MILETERLVLREFKPEDAPFILRLLNEPSFLQNIGDRGVRTLEDAVRYLNEVPIASYLARGHGLWLVSLSAGGEAIGMCGLIKRDQFPDVDLGYAFLPEFWSKGYAREAASATLGVARGMGLARVVAFVSPANAPSIRLLAKLGFVPEGRARMSPTADEVLVYALSLA